MCSSHMDGSFVFGIPKSRGVSFVRSTGFMSKKPLDIITDSATVRM